jgi:hypothetical protein
LHSGRELLRGTQPVLQHDQRPVCVSKRL